MQRVASCGLSLSSFHRLSFGGVVAHAREAATDTCHAAEVLILCPYETYQGNDAHEHLLYHHSCLCHNLFVFFIVYTLFLNHDAKLRRFPARSNKTADFRLRSMRCAYDICGRNGKVCHNCRKGNGESGKIVIKATSLPPPTGGRSFHSFTPMLAMNQRPCWGISGASMPLRS